MANIFDRIKQTDRALADMNNTAAQLSGKKSALLDQLEKLMGHRDPKKAQEELEVLRQEKDEMEERLNVLLNQIEERLNE